MVCNVRNNTSRLSQKYFGFGIHSLCGNDHFKPSDHLPDIKILLSSSHNVTSGSILVDYLLSKDAHTVVDYIDSMHSLNASCIRSVLIYCITVSLPHITFHTISYKFRKKSQEITIDMFGFIYTMSSVVRKINWL